MQFSIVFKTFEKECRNTKENEFVECLVYSQERAVVMTGKQVDSCAPDKLNEIGRWFKPWFFKHVETFFDYGGESTEYIRLRDYYHRHSRQAQWRIYMHNLYLHIKFMVIT